jgi:Na+/phosphate symporter
MPDRLRFRYRTLLLWLVTLSVMAYALFEEYRPSERLGVAADGDAEPESETDKLRIVSVEPSELQPGAAMFVHIAGLDPQHTGSVSAEVAKQPAQILQRSQDQLIVRVPPGLGYGQAKLRVLQADRRSKGWSLRLRPLPRHDMLRDVVGGLALFLLGLRTVGRALRAYAGRRVRSGLSRLTRDRPRSLGLGALTGLLTQSTTSAAGLFAGLLGARMVQLPVSVVLMIGAQLGAAVAAVLLPRFATGEALWVLVIGALWVLLAESRLSRALGSIVVGTGLIFHGLGLLQAGCAPLISDPQVVPYLSYLQAGGIGGVLACAAAGAVLSALLQGPAPLYALALSLLQENVLSLRDALAVLAGVSLGGLFNIFAAAWVFGADARRLVRSQLALSLAMTALAIAGLPAWLWVAERVAAVGGSAGPPGALALGAGFLSLQGSVTLLGFVLVPFGMRTSAAWSLDSGLRPVRALGSAHAQALLRALTLCHQGLQGVREIIDSSDRSSAPATERALEQAREILREILRATPNDSAKDAPPKAASVACLHLADALLSTLRVAEKAPELGFSPSGEGARALERLHEMLDKALTSVCEQLAHERTLSITDAQAREIEINAVEAETRRHLFADASAGEDLALRLWSSELCAAYETVGNQVYRAASAVSARPDDD